MGTVLVTGFPLTVYKKGGSLQEGRARPGALPRTQRGLCEKVRDQGSGGAAAPRPP